jgi:hypothetical protein
MTNEELVQRFETLTKEMVLVMKAKNNDYSSKKDPLQNLRRHGSYGVVVRMDDKIARLNSFYNPEERKSMLVPGETKKDTAIDLANYALLCFILDEENDAQIKKA